MTISPVSLSLSIGPPQQLPQSDRRRRSAQPLPAPKNRRRLRRWRRRHSLVILRRQRHPKNETAIEEHFSNRRYEVGCSGDVPAACVLGENPNARPDAITPA